MTSPQLASCAPSSADLPLPSSTTSPVHSQDAKAIVVRQRTPSSLKLWLSPSHESPGQTTPRLRRVLSPCSQSTTSSTSPTERRVKRRLEPGPPAVCECAEECDCVTELYPVTKKSRTLSGICCAAQENQEQTDCNTEDMQAVPRQTGKENFSPRVDWLSVMGQKLRKDQGSPCILRSPSSSKKQESKMPASPVSTSHLIKKNHIY